MRFTRLLVLCVFALLGHRADGMFVHNETARVPIDRVLTNLQQRLAKNTNDFAATYYLARVYSMAYSTNLVDVAIGKKDDLPQFGYPGSDAGVPHTVKSFETPAARKPALSHLTNAIVFYERAIVLLKNSTNVTDRRWMIFPTQLGLAWCLDQSGRTNDAKAMYRETLRVAWKDETKRNHLGPGVCYSEETIGYLLKLLDPVKDAKEIAKLKKDQKTLESLPRAITPMIIPLEAGTFDEFVNESAGVEFDLDGSGLKRKWGWVTPKAGWLVYDPAKTGRIDSALQMFGNVTFWIFWPDGYAALSSLDDNGDGVVSGLELRGLAVWNDRNCNGISDPGEVIPVEDLEIESISCRSEIEGYGTHWNPTGVVFTNGLSRATYDWIVPGGR